MLYSYICSPYRGNIFKRIRNKRYARYLTKLMVDFETMEVLKMDRVINIITYAGVFLITLGALTAIWGGLVGFKIAGSGVVLILTAMALSYCNEEIKLEKRRRERY